VGSAAEEDSALVEAARNGDVESYARLVERYETVAHRTAYMLGAGDDAADVVQDAFMKAYAALGRFNADKPFRPWLLTIVANETRNRWRWLSRHRIVPLALMGDDLPQASGRSPQEVAEDRETGRTLRDAVNALPRQQREVIVCRYLLDLSERDTAQVLRIPHGTVKSRTVPRASCPQASAWSECGGARYHRAGAQRCLSNPKTRRVEMDRISKRHCGASVIRSTYRHSRSTQPWCDGSSRGAPSRVDPGWVRFGTCVR
jgi:RNA polymerase sigma factor (sigma-70 family)